MATFNPQTITNSQRVVLQPGRIQHQERAGETVVGHVEVVVGTSAGDEQQAAALVLQVLHN